MCFRDRPSEQFSPYLGACHAVIKNPRGLTGVEGLGFILYHGMSSASRHALQTLVDGPHPLEAATASSSFVTRTASELPLQF